MIAEESKVLSKLIEKVYSFVKNQENWFEQLPKSFSEEFNHSTFGLITFTFDLSFSKKTDLNIIRYYLNFRISQGNSYIERTLSMGERSKVVNDILIFLVDQSSIESSLPDLYMGLWEYPRP